MRKRTKNEYLTLTLLLGILILNFTLRTFPSLENPIPYGDVDAAAHTILVNKIIENSGLIEKEPEYIPIVASPEDFKYIHSPLYHSGIAALVLASSLDIRIIIGLITTFGVVSLFVLSKYIFKKNWISLLVCFFQAINIREIYSIFWGQWGVVIGLSFIPFAIYLLLRAIDSKFNRKIIIASAFVAGIIYLIHPLTFFFYLACSFGILILKFKKINFKKKWREILIFTCILSVMLLIYIPGKKWGTSYSRKISLNDTFSIIFFLAPSPNPGETLYHSKLGYNMWYVYDINMIFGIPLLIFSAIGFLFSLILAIKKKIKKKEKNLLLPMLFITMFFLFSYAVIFTTSSFWVTRGLPFLATLLALLSGVGCLIISRIKGFSKYVKIISLIIITYYIFSVSNIFQSAFPRLNEYEISALNWIKKNTQENSTFIFLEISGNQILLNKMKNIWMPVFSERKFFFPKVENGEISLENYDFFGKKVNITHIMVTRAPNLKTQMKNFELIYSNEYVDVLRRLK